jgi:hypothetical protein
MPVHLPQKGVAKVHSLRDEIESVKQQLLEKDVTIEELKNDLVRIFLSFMCVYARVKQ